MRIQNQADERWLPLLKTVTGAGVTFFALDNIKTAMATEALCINKWIDACVELTKGAHAWCTEESFKHANCTVENSATKAMMIFGVFAVLFTTKALADLCLDKRRVVHPLR